MLTGFAKSDFFNKYQRSPWKTRPASFIHSWPLLEAFLAQQKISYLDYILTHKLLVNHPQAQQEVAFFICHLILAARNGHLCIQLSELSIRPAPHEVWARESSNSLTPDELEIINQLILQGAKSIPTDLMTQIQFNSTQDKPLTPLCRYRNIVYLQRHWVFESLFLKDFKRLSSSRARLMVDSNQVHTSVQTLCHQGLLLEEQAEAIIKGCESPLSFITGGPGTGKTYTAGYLIKIFWENLTVDQRGQCRIALAAPTGKAAANLQKSLRRISDGLDQFPILTAKTIHSLLGVKKGVDRPRLMYDLLLIDESSMIDIKMMAYLFEALQEGSRLILLGDPYQLPPVESGNVFSDLIHLQQQKTVNLVHTQLKTCLRSELKSIIDFADHVNQGNWQEVFNTIKSSSQVGIRHVLIPSDNQEGQKLFLSHMSHIFPSHVKRGSSDIEILNLFNGVRILSPLRKGCLGVDTLNQLLWLHFSQISHNEGYLAIPIIIVANQYRQNLFNGETGVLVRHLPLGKSQGLGGHADDYALFASCEADGEAVRKISAILLPKYEYAYCLSVHKSQGSEFDRVVLVMPEGSELFGREVFYTAVTRARKQLDLYGSEAILQKTIDQRVKRLSGIEHRLELG